MIGDVKKMAEVINDCAEQGMMLHRSYAELYEGVRDFMVVVDVDNGEVVGVGGLRVMWANLAEVYAVALSESVRGKGIGCKLVARITDQAKELGISCVFTLTYEGEFFSRCGFDVVDRYELPAKVWSECVRCAKRECCDEIAMRMVVDGVEEVVGTEVEEGWDDKAYSVPVVIKGLGKKKNEDE